MPTMITIPLEDYAELVEYRARINIAYGLITAEHEEAIKLCGKKSTSLNASVMETALGYLENDNHFEKLKKEYKERMRRRYGKIKSEQCSKD